MSRVPVLDAIVLAGGAARRLGGASKPDVVVAGRTLLDRVLDATAGARDVVVVGPPALARPGVRTTLEDPPGGGPVAGIEAGLGALPAAADGALVLVLACDIPQAAPAVTRLVAALVAEPEADGTHLVDADGHAQLVALFRRGPLRARLDALAADAGVRDVSVRRMLDGLRTVGVPDDGAAQDADTWADVARLDALLAPDLTDARVNPTEPEVNRMSEQPTPAAPTPSDLHRWVVAVTEHLGTDPDAMDVDLLLDLARDVAHTVARPAVPLTTFLAGYAVALGGGDRAALENVVGEVARMVERWPDVGADADVKAAGSSGGGAGAEDDAGADSPSSQDVRNENAEWSGEGTA